MRGSDDSWSQHGAALASNDSEACGAALRCDSEDSHQSWDEHGASALAPCDLPHEELAHEVDVVGVVAPKKRSLPRKHIAAIGNVGSLAASANHHNPTPISATESHAVVKVPRSLDLSLSATHFLD